ncbi:TPA: HI1506-related protein [Vibrio harveyi]
MSDKVKLILVINSAHDGYRRAGMAFQNGENTIAADEITETQLAQIQADPHLKYQLSENNAQSGETSGALDANEHGMSLIDAIKTLDVDNESHFTKGGKPELKALSTILGRNVSGSERDDAWSALQAESANNEDGE